MSSIGDRRITAYVSVPLDKVAHVWSGWPVSIFGSQTRGQDESDGPLGVYAVGLVGVFACHRASPRAVASHKFNACLVFGGTKPFSGPA